MSRPPPLLTYTTGLEWMWARGSAGLLYVVTNDPTSVIEINNRPRKLDSLTKLFDLFSGGHWIKTTVIAVNICVSASALGTVELLL